MIACPRCKVNLIEGRTGTDGPTGKPIIVLLDPTPIRRYVLGGRDLRQARITETYQVHRNCHPAKAVDCYPGCPQHDPKEALR